MGPLSQRLAGKVAAITGAASGLGAATAKRFVAEGANVVLGDLQETRLSSVAADLGSHARFMRCDVTHEDDVSALVDLAIDQFGQLDVMFNNAGFVGAVGPIDTTPAAEWTATLAVLLDGVFFGMKHAARVMKPRGHGSIISTSSAGGLIGGIGPHAYCTAKHAVVGLTKNVAAELCHFGIRVNAIAPGSMATSLSAALRTGDPDAIEATAVAIAESSPLRGRAGVAEDVANAVLWLASDESGYTTGHTLTTDAGLTAGARSPGEASRWRRDYAPMIREAGKRGLPDS